MYKRQVLAYVGSNSSATFFPKQVQVSDTESHDISLKVLPNPSFAGSEEVAVQQGAGMVVTKDVYKRQMLYHHFLNPVVAMVSFLLFEREPRLPLASVPLALVPTIVYGVYDLWGNITGRIDGPYPFMRVYDQTIQESLMWFAIILEMCIRDRIRRSALSF